MTRRIVFATFALSIASSPVLAVSDDDMHLARNYLRCASFYVIGSKTVTKPELKKQLEDLANISLYSAELLMEKDRPLVKAEFETAREKFYAETETEEVKADTRGFMKYMGEYCTSLREKNQAKLPVK